VKSNIGHLESAAGVAGLTKILLQMKHGKLVPSLHCNTTNPNIHFAQTPFRLQKMLVDWNRISSDGSIQPRLACLSSFGAGGANAHAVVQEHWEDPSSTQLSPGARALVVLSARDVAALKRLAERLLVFTEPGITPARSCIHFAGWTRADGRTAGVKRK
jgi:acyl transferase domain-containing protein